MDDIDNYVYPTPKDCAGKDPVYVGRIRESIAFDNAIDLFCVADNLRIGAALNTVRIAESVVRMGLYGNNSCFVLLQRLWRKTKYMKALKESMYDIKI